MSQPFDRAASCPAPGKIDESLGEFWVGDPWLVGRKNNLSAFERNRAYLNTRGTNFVDISYISGLDSDGDARASVAADMNNDGRMDLLVRQIGGGPLKLYENRFPKKNWLVVSLRGVQSHSQGIGARVVVTTDAMTMTRELYPHNTFYSQGPAYVHFGLGKARRIKKVSIRWPNSSEQVLYNVRSNQHIVVVEGAGDYDTISLR